MSTHVCVYLIRSCTYVCMSVDLLVHVGTWVCVGGRGRWVGVWINFAY